MRSKWTSYIAAFIWISVLFNGCVPEEKPDMNRIHKEVELRIDKYTKHKKRKCIESIINEVEAAVDSTLLQRAMSGQKTQMPVPNPGSRPTRPNVGFPKFDLKRKSSEGGE